MVSRQRTSQQPDGGKHRVLQWLTYMVTRIAICLMQALHIETCHAIARGVGYLAYDLLKLRRQVIDENLRHAFPAASPAARQQLARQMWTHVFLLVCELAQVPRKIHDTNWRNFVRMSPQDMRIYVRHLLDTRPTVVVSGHFGNFEVGGVLSGLLGFPSYTVARPLDNPYLHRFINRFRGATGQFILPKQGSAPQIDGILRSGGTLVLLGDQAAGAKGCWVEFFGRPASCHKAVALFSLVNRAPMLLAYTKRLERPMYFEIGLCGLFDPAVDQLAGVQQLTQWYSERLEQVIRTAPEQYWWLHRRWKGPEPRRRRTATRVDVAAGETNGAGHPVPAGGRAEPHPSTPPESG